MEDQEKWMELCALASNEQDPAKLLVLTREIARLLAEKEQRVKEIHRQLKEQEEGKGDVSSIPLQLASLLAKFPQPAADCLCCRPAGSLANLGAVHNVGYFDAERQTFTHQQRIVATVQPTDGVF